MRSILVLSPAVSLALTPTCLLTSRSASQEKVASMAEVWRLELNDPEPSRVRIGMPSFTVPSNIWSR